MLASVTIDSERLDAAPREILAAWERCTVLHIRAPHLEPGNVREFYDRLLPLVGTKHFFAEDVRVGERDVQRTGELWMEVRYDPSIQGAYRHSASAQPLHTDGSYIASYPNASLMCCVRNADAGGETTFVAAETLVDALRVEAPDLLEKLERLPMPHARSGDRRVYPVIRRVAGELRLTWNYYCVAPDAPREALALRESFHEFLKMSPAVARSVMPVKLSTGDAVTWKDERVLHGRNAFHATSKSERFLWKCAVDVGVFAPRPSALGT